MCIRANKERILWLDIAKGIAMVAVVFSHEFASVKSLVLFCNSFMLPLFFMCSGYCMSPQKYDIITYLKRKAKVLLLPYLILGLIVSFLQIPTNGLDSILQNILLELFSWQTLWFLPVLFCSDAILYFILSKNKNNTLAKVLRVEIIFLILGISFCKLNITLPIDLATVPISIFYMAIGYRTKYVVKTISIKLKIIIGGVLFLTGIILLMLTEDNLILKLNDILPISKLIFSSIESIGLLFLLSSLITSNILRTLHYVLSPLEFIGKNTMVIFAFHMPIFFYCQTYIRPYINNQLYYKPIEFIVIWVICLLLIPIFNKYTPFFIGKGYNK